MQHTAKYISKVIKGLLVLQYRKDYPTPASMNSDASVGNGFWTRLGSLTCRVFAELSAPLPTNEDSDGQNETDGASNRDRE